MVQHTFENKNKYKDFDLSFSRNPLTDDVSIKTDANAINQSLRILLNTYYYERPFRPDVGSNLRRILFEPADPITIQDLRASIETLIINYEPRIDIIDMKVQDLSEMNAYNITIEYTLVNMPISMTFETTLRRLR
jgi:phage baseplate assembly protein W